MAPYEHKIQKAILEARLFIEQAEALLARGEERKQARRRWDKNESYSLDLYMLGTRASGKLKRQSMELSAALVRLRK